MRSSAGYAQVEGTPQPKEAATSRVHLVMVLPQSLAHTGLVRLSAWC